MSTVGWLSAAVEKLRDNCRRSECNVDKNHSHPALASGDDSITEKELGHDSSTSGPNTKSERENINENEIRHTHIAGKNTTLDSGTVGDSFIRVNTLTRFLAEILLEELLDLRETSGTTNKNSLE